MKASATVLANAALLIAYFAAAELGLSFFALIHPSASAVWLPTGIAMSALLLGGLRLAPAVFAGAFLANATIEGSVGTSLGVALGNTLEAVLAVTLVERFAGGRDAFTSPARILRFMVLGALLSPIVSATIGVLSLSLGGVADAASSAVWFTWWLGDAAGAVLVTPLVVLWWTSRDWGRMGRRSGEAVLMIAAIGIVGAVAFFHPYLSQYPLAFLCLAPLVWGALRFGPREIATAVVVLAIFATAATVTGRGQFARLTPNESLLVLQGFLVVISMTVLPMAALTVERRAALQRERAARAETDAASRAKDEFIAILSHELRNPLAAISMAAAVLDTGAHTRESSLRLVASIRRQSQHLARLIDDLLDMSRLTANKLILRKEPVELGDAVRRCVEAISTTRGLAPGRIELELEAVVWIDADPVRVTQVMENLLGNALKHTPLGKRIRVIVRDLGAVAELCVEDEGFGIRPELLPAVFEPFTQGEQGLDRSAGGLGLGLTLVRRLTELHGGTIAAQSGGVDRGSAFTLQFPSRPAPFGAVATASQHARSERPRRLLVVEDNVDARQTLRTLLEALGHEVEEAADGEAGVAAALERRPDLVFVDIGLPRLDGYEVARRLREANFGARLVALTGYGRDDDVKRAREAGFDEHLLKPATLEQLRAAIDALAVA